LVNGTEDVVTVQASLQLRRQQGRHDWLQNPRRRAQREWYGAETVRLTHPDQTSAPMASIIGFQRSGSAWCPVQTRVVIKVQCRFRWSKCAKAHVCGGSIYLCHRCITTVHVSVA
jgi:hypothetical protein